MKTIQEIIDNIYELEGLMREIMHRDDEAPADLYDTACAKASSIAQYVAEIVPERSEPDIDIELIVDDDDIDDDEPQAEPQAEPEYVEVPETESVIETATEPQPIEEPGQADETEPQTHTFETTSRPQLRRMFSINDLFRFKRELFGNSDSDMNDVFNMVMAMHDYSEAEEYFYGYLCWPEDNEQVADFMSVIHKYFSNAR